MSEDDNKQLTKEVILARFERYNFVDEMGHSLVNCVDFLELVERVMNPPTILCIEGPQDEDLHNKIKDQIEKLKGKESFAKPSMINLERTFPISTIIANLNSMLAADPQTVQDLLRTYHPCSEKLADHPTCQVSVDEEGKTSVSGVGFLNGMLGADADGWGFVAAFIDGESGKITGFGKAIKPATPMQDES